MGARRLHLVRLEPGSDRLVVADRLVARLDGPVAAAGSDAGSDAGGAGGAPVAMVQAAIRFCRGAARVAVDGPAGPSAGAHRHDHSVAPKFRAGRCSEIPVRGIPAVSWVTPTDVAAAPGWMRTSFGLWATLVAAGLDVVETFPAAGFHRLQGGRWPPPKATPAGRARRLDLLRPVVALPPDAGAWTHDDIDATMAALAAAVGVPVPHACPNFDGSALWLPPIPAPAAG